jgi:predicted KAP-like P-loop ATPase
MAKEKHVLELEECSFDNGHLKVEVTCSENGSVCLSFQIDGDDYALHLHSRELRSFIRFMEKNAVHLSNSTNSAVDR